MFGRKLILCQGLLALVIYSSLLSEVHVKSEPIRSNDSNKTITDEMLHKLLEVLRESVGPVYNLDPIKINYTDIFASVNSTINNVTLGNINNFQTLEAHSNMTTYIYTFKIFFETIPVAGLYDVVLDCDLLYLFGNGPLRASVNNVTIQVDLKLGFDTKQTIIILGTPVVFDVEFLQVRVDGLYGGGAASDAINDLINDSAPQLIEAAKPTIENLAANTVTNFASFLIRGQTMDQLVDFINELIGG